jgi:hypothetical protein
MGAAYYTQRGAWRVGDSNNGSSNHIQNDVAVILSNSDIGGFVNDGIGHTLATATPMPLSGSNINAALAEGVITTTRVRISSPVPAYRCPSPEQGRCCWRSYSLPSPVAAAPAGGTWRPPSGSNPISH